MSRFRRKRRTKVALALPLLLAFWFLVLSVRIYTYSHETYSARADAAIVLGAAIWEGHPSPVFKERIKHAINLYEMGQVQAIIFTGGVGYGDLAAESEVAMEYAIQHGIPAQHIYIETRSRTTRENLQEAKSILTEQALATVVIVSDPLHMMRAMMIATDLGMNAYPSPTPTSRYQTWRSKLTFLLRETCFSASYLLRKPFF